MEGNAESVNFEVSLERLSRAGVLLTRTMDAGSLIDILLDQVLDFTRCDIAAVYVYNGPGKKSSGAKLVSSRGRYELPPEFSEKSQSLVFIRESRESIVLLSRKPFPFDDILLDPSMHSGIMFPLFTHKDDIGFLVVNSQYERYFKRDLYEFCSAFVELAGGMLNNSQLHSALREHVRKTEALERYQENIFSSMTNILVTTDSNGAMQYANARAREMFCLTDEHIGKSVAGVFHSNLSKKILDVIMEKNESGEEALGIEGIYKNEGRGLDIDFSLNLSPLRGKRGKKEGLTLVFTDQTREQALKKEMDFAVEERRVIKDMFARYLSNDIVQSLMDQPELVKPGGGKKRATVLFADIRGYTSFSEGKSPEYIVGVLNEYFNEAVEIVIKHKGYIDKFIGDCIMAAWGVPLCSEAEDAFSAVLCAVEMQKLVNSAERPFFKGDAGGLKIGIGMHTGELVAGNLGSHRRMDYTVIGDTVNVAARLEGVAGPGEIIITEDTKSLLGSTFALEKRDTVSVKGKSRPIKIYNVKDIA